MARALAVRFGAVLLHAGVLIAPARASSADAGVPQRRGEVAPFTMPGPRLFDRQTQSRLSDRLSPLRFGSRQGAVREAAKASRNREPLPEAPESPPEPRRTRTRDASGRVQAFEIGDDLTVLSNRGDERLARARVPRPAPPPPVRAKPPSPREPVAHERSAAAPLIAAASLDRREARIDRVRRERPSSTSNSLLPKLAIVVLLIGGGFWLKLRSASRAASK